MRKRTIIGIVIVCTALAIAEAAGTSTGTSTSTPRASYYLALGDSLAIGVQPEGDTDRGYTNLLAARLQRTQPGLVLEELGCGGETAESMLHGEAPRSGSCRPHQPAQLAEAVSFLAEHKDDVRLVTIDIGGNDMMDANCAQSPDPACPAQARAALHADLSEILQALRAAAPETRIVGMTYYNPNAAEWLHGPEGRARATATAANAAALSDMLRATYEAFDVQVADVAAAFSSTDFSTMVELAQFQALPLATAKVCALTWICVAPPEGPDIHANDAGYALIADTFAAVISSS